MRLASAVVAIGLAMLSGDAAGGERLFFATAKPGPVHATPLQPFTVDLVVERSDAAAQMSAVAYTLAVPDGILLVGEELLVDSLLGLGSSLEGMNLVFQCTKTTPLPVLRFRFVATRPVRDAVVALRPEPLTHFLGFVSCKEENFLKFKTAPDSFVVNAR
jgi:hypothetical protein